MTAAPARAPKTVAELVTERPSRARVFERLGIDYCCGGKVPFTQACAVRGLDPQAVLREIADCDAGSTPPSKDWSRASLTELADHIEATHHAYLRRELPRLLAMTAKIASVHGQRHPELVRVATIFESLSEEMQQHMMKEEQILFPMVRQLESADSPPCSHCGGVANPIAVMESEHDNAGEALAQMRELTDRYTPPADACNTYRATLDSLRELELDLHQHVHKENNILFPRAIAAEAALARG